MPEYLPAQLGDVVDGLLDGSRYDHGVELNP